MKRPLLILVFIISFLISGKVFAQDGFSEYVPYQNEVLFNQSMFRIDALDPVASTNWKGINYPGLRGSNQLVIYTPSFGLRTNTNEFGTEAIVVGNTVTSLSGADSLIPANGFVISGHGQAKNWINENIMVGSKIYLDVDKKIITSYITSDTFLYAAQLYVNYSQKKTEQSLEKAKEFIVKAQKNSEDSQKYSSRAIEYANQAMSTVIPYDSNELKGIWIRPTYFNKADIVDVLDRLENVGINNVFIETYYHGKTIFPSKTMEKYGFIKQYEDFEGFDPLRIWINEAHKRDIKVHIWFQTFYVGNKPPETHPEYILAQRPSWANCQKKNANSQTIAYSVSEHNGYFLDPANPEVQGFLYELLCEIVHRYQPDGINLDYIRYPQSINPDIPGYENSTWGYTSYTREGFKSKYEVDPIDLTRKDCLWDEWLLFRANRITDFVRRASELCKSQDVPMTAVIFPNNKSALTTKMQDWRSWSKNEYVDGFTPLFLTCDPKTASSMISDINNNKSKATKLYAGLFVTFIKGSPDDLIRILHESRRFGLSGAVIFDYAHFGSEYMNVLTASAFNDGTLNRVETENTVRKVGSVCTKCKPDKKCRKCRKLEKRKNKEMAKREKMKKK